MLSITVPGQEYYDEENEKFFETKAVKLILEHSLVSLAKWESKWKKPFLSTKEKTREETLDYVRCMTITQNVDENTYMSLSAENMEQIKNYIDDPMSATTFYDLTKGGKKKVITAELIYFWMINFNIPSEYRKWHLNSLLTLIRVCNIETSGNKKKMSRNDIYKHNKALNAQRRAKLNSSG